MKIVGKQTPAAAAFLNRRSDKFASGHVRRAGTRKYLAIIGAAAAIDWGLDKVANRLIVVSTGLPMSDRANCDKTTADLRARA